jgi:hypothetical protein
MLHLAKHLLQSLDAIPGLPSGISLIQIFLEADECLADVLGFAKVRHGVSNRVGILQPKQWRQFFLVKLVRDATNRFVLDFALRRVILKMLRRAVFQYSRESPDDYRAFAFLDQRVPQNSCHSEQSEEPWFDLRRRSSRGCPISRLLCEKWGFGLRAARHCAPAALFPMQHLSRHQTSAGIQNGSPRSRNSTK